MNRATTTQRGRARAEVRKQQTAARLSLEDLHDLIGDGDNPVHCETVGEFLNRMPCKNMNLTLEDKNRFGDKVKRTADGILQIPFMAKKHDSLVALRVYPAPLLEWMFGKMFGAPTLSLEDGRLRKAESMKRNLQSVADDAPPDVRENLDKVLAWLEEQSRKLRAIDNPPTMQAGSPQLRPV